MATNSPGTISITIGGALGASLQNSVQGARRLVDNLSDSMRHLQRTSDRISSFRNLNTRLQKTGENLTKARERLSALRKQFEATENPTKALTNEVKRAEQQVEKLSAAHKRQSQQLDKVGAELKAAGVNTRNLALEQARLTLASRRLAAQREKISTLRNRSQALREQRQQLRGQVLEVVALAAAFVRVIQPAAQFEETMSRITGLVGIASEETAKLRRGVLSLRGVDAGPQQLSEALFFVTSAGFRGAEALDVLEASAKAATAGLGETKTVADAVTSAVNAYGPEVLSAGKATGILVASVREGKVEASQLAGVLGRVTPIASELGVSFDQLGAAIAAMTRLGTSADESATQLRSVMTGLLKPTTDAEKALDEYNLTSAGLRKTLREDGLLSLLTQLKKTFGDNEDAMARVFPNVRALSGVLNLVGKSAENNIGIFERLAQATEEDVDKALSAAAKNVKFQVKQMRNALSRLAITIGDSLGPAIIAVSVSLATMADSLTALLEAAPGVSSVLVTLLASLVALRVASFTLSFGINAVRTAATKLRLAQALLSSQSLKTQGAIHSLAPKVLRTGEASKTATGSVAGLRKALRRLGALRLAGLAIIVGQLAEIVRLHFEAKRIADQQEDQRQKTIRDAKTLASVNKFAAETQVLSAEELSELSDIERRQYRRRLEAARKFYRARQKEALAAGNDLRATLTGFEGEAGGGEDAALALGLSARQYESALEDVEAVEEQRAERVEEVAEKVKEAKEKETAAVKRELAEQIKAHEDANDRLEELGKQRAREAERFESLIDELQAVGREEPEGPPGILDQMGAVDDVRLAASKGDLQETLRAAERVRQVLRARAEAEDLGILDRQSMISAAQEAQQAVEQAFAARETQLEESREQARKQIDSLIQRAGKLAKIEIGYDKALVTKNTEEIRQLIVDLIERTSIGAAIEVPIKFQVEASGAEKTAQDLLEEAQKNARRTGGMIGPAQLAGGGHLSGYGGGDRRPAMLEDGEFVARKEAVRRYGPALFDALNRMILPPDFARSPVVGFQSGGLVGGGAPAGTGGTPVHVHLDGRDFPLRAEPDVARELLDVLQGAARKTARRKR